MKLIQTTKRWIGCDLPATNTSRTPRVDDKERIALPIQGDVHVHPGGICSIHCKLTDSVKLVIAGFDVTKSRAGFPRVVAGNQLAGFLEPADPEPAHYESDYNTALQLELEESKVIDDLIANWKPFGGWIPGRWFHFHAESELLNQLFSRLQRFAESTSASFSDD